MCTMISQQAVIAGSGKGAGGWFTVRQASVSYDHPFDAVVDCWGGRVVMAPDELTPKQPVAPLDYTADLACPLLGLFGAEDHSPTPEQVARHEQELKKYGKVYEFHMYPGAGHGFFYYDRPNYRQEQAVDGWQKLLAFLGKHLAADTSG